MPFSISRSKAYLRYCCIALARNLERNVRSSAQAISISAKPMPAMNSSAPKRIVVSPEIRSEIPLIVHEITSSDTAARNAASVHQ